MPILAKEVPGDGGVVLPIPVSDLAERPIWVPFR